MICRMEEPMSVRDDSAENDALNGLEARGHDYLWARLPFLVPMAAKIARASCGTSAACGPLAQLVDQLRSLTLRHLDREERLLARLSALRDDGLMIGELASLRAEHCELQDLLGRVCIIAGLPEAPAAGACPTIHAFHQELRSLDRHLREQIRIEDEILGSRIAAAHGQAAKHDVPCDETKTGTQ